jgi:LacI family repressor for deo operon, udp, cdd, tsx, nupC, and nupG
MPVSIKDVARAVGVSHSTVSRALSNSSLVREETKIKIQQVAAEMGYTPNAAARSLVTKRTGALGLVVTTIADPFIAEVVRGIEETALDEGYGVILSQSNAEVSRELAAVRALREKRVDAVIVSASRVGDLYMPLLEEIQVPIVLVNSEQSSKRVHFVLSDDFQGGRLATEYLLSLGHRRIGYITGPPEHKSSEHRLRGYRQALQLAGVEPDSNWISQGTGHYHGGEKALQALLSVALDVTAVFCYNDTTAIGALRFARHRGMRVPEDISIIGFDDILYASYTEPPLTTIAQQKYEMGRLVARMAFELIAGQQVQDIVLPTRLVIRESCAKAG